MRIFTTFPEAFNEIKRDLKEMGTRVVTKTMQDKNIEGLEEYETIELMNYVYTVTAPELTEIDCDPAWCTQEWRERLRGLEGHPINPGISWRINKELWEPFIHRGKFDYTYSERLSRSSQVQNIIKRLRDDNYSRQCYISMWNHTDSVRLGIRRVPCSLGWHLMYRGTTLHMTYFMRSCDFGIHFYNDVYLSLKLLHEIAVQAGMIPGRFSHFISSFHVYEKDLSGVF